MGAIGVGLYPGSSDTLTITVQDNLSSLTLFEAYAFGCTAVGGF